MLEARSVPAYPVLPALDESNADFWTAGRDNELRISGCRNCGQLFHPPAPICRRCRSRDVAPQVTTGRGRLWAWSVNFQDWGYGAGDDFVYAIVELDDQPQLRITSHVVGVAEDQLYVGMPLEADFAEFGQVWVVRFRPRGVTG